MLARKFLHYQQDRPKITGEETEEELSGPAPRSLYLLAACMIKVGCRLQVARQHLCLAVGSLHCVSCFPHALVMQFRFP